MPKRLLVVDDEPNLLRAVAACLKAENYEVSTARSAHEALVQLAEAVPEVSRGLSNKEIAAELEISVRTVENHISHILDKKGFSNRVEIARYVFEQKN